GVEIVQRAEQGIDVAVVTDVVAGVTLRRAVERGQPDGVDVQFGKPGQLGGNPGEIADAVAVQVPERARVHLVDDGRTPPSGNVVCGVHRGQRTRQGAGQRC